MSESTETLVATLRSVADEIPSFDGVANDVIRKAASRMEEQQALIAELEKRNKTQAETIGSYMDDEAKRAVAEPCCGVVSQLRSKVEALRREAEIHAQEARTANGTIAEIYQMVTGATGEPGNWNGAEPLAKKLSALQGALISIGEWIQKLPIPTKGACAQLFKIDAALGVNGERASGQGLLDGLSPEQAPVAAVANGVARVTMPVDFLGEYYELLCGVKYRALHTMVRKAAVEAMAEAHGFKLPEVSEQAMAEVDAGALAELLEQAAEDIQEWGAYASAYFQEKHNLAANVAKYREASSRLLAGGE